MGKRALAVYILTTEIKGISSMKLRRDIGVTQKTAWRMAHRIREFWDKHSNALAYTLNRKKCHSTHDPVGNMAISSSKDRQTTRVSLDRYATTFKGREHRHPATITDQMAPKDQGMDIERKKLMYRELVS